ncbi:TPA: leucine-rich repeat domain-containing protein, partial [Escherichia fergusonii]|nr:leucine-rich repeat domain-containing protein [Escherichia fergusonii]
MLQALFSPEEHPVHPRTLATWPASSCHQLLSLLCAENAAELASGDRKLLNQMLLQMTGTGIHDTYHTPVFDDGSRLTLNLSVAGQATLTAYAPGQTLFCGLTLTPVHPAWADVCNGPVHATLIHEWRNWSAEPAPGERRDEALRRVTECVVQGETKLNLDNLGLSSLPELPDSLTVLFARNNQLTTLPELPDSLTVLFASNNQLTTLPELPDSLTVLFASNNQLTTLQELPDSLKHFDVSNNQLTTLPELPDLLTKLDVSNNQLTTLPELPDSLTVLFASNNQLTTLPELPDSLTVLFASYNQLTTLPELPDSLTVLFASNNQLTTLQELPDSLKHLDVSNNQLTTLPELPDSLTKLDVSNNKLTNLPELPASLKILDVGANQLTDLPELPPSLTSLEVNYNYLADLPPLPASLQGQDVGFSNQRTGSSALASAIVPWYPEKRPEIVCPAWFPRAAEENTPSFTEFLKQLNENACARLPEFRGRVAAWLDELLITPELCTLSFAIAQEASATCTDRAALGWNNMQVGRLLFHAVRNEQTTADAFITLARQIFRLRQTERIAGEKVLALTAAHEDVDEIEVYLAYQTRLKVPLGLPDCLAPEMQFGFLARVTPEDINIAAETVLLAEEGEFGNWLNNWEPCQQFLLKRMSEDEREELTERRIAVYSEQLEELRLEFRDAGAGTDVDRVLGVRATEATNNAIFGP